MLAQSACKTAHLHCHTEHDLQACLLQTLQQHKSKITGMYSRKNSAQVALQCVTICYASCQGGCLHNFMDCIPASVRRGRHTRPRSAGSVADNSRVIGPALGRRPLCLHPKPDQPLDINHKHVILELASIIHPSKDEQAALRQHSAAVASACWQWFACLPCMAPHDISAFAFIDSKMILCLPHWSGMCCHE